MNHFITSVLLAAAIDYQKIRTKQIIGEKHYKNILRCLYLLVLSEKWEGFIQHNVNGVVLPGQNI